MSCPCESTANDITLARSHVLSSGGPSLYETTSRSGLTDRSVERGEGEMRKNRRLTSFRATATSTSSYGVPHPDGRGSRDMALGPAQHDPPGKIARRTPHPG